MGTFFMWSIFVFIAGLLIWRRKELVRISPYSVADLGEISPTIAPAGRINAAGLLYSTHKDGSTGHRDRAAYKSANGQWEDLYYHPLSTSEARGCNDRWMAVGVRDNAAVLWDADPALSDAQILVAASGWTGGPAAVPTSINNSRKVVGYSVHEYDANSNPVVGEALLWDTTVTSVTQSSLGVTGMANAINDAGEIVGTGMAPNAAVYWKNDTARTRTNILENAEGNDINGNGVVAGSFSENGVWRGFTWDAASGGQATLAPIKSGILSGAEQRNCKASALNDALVIVGKSWNDGASSSQTRAAVWYGSGNAKDLNSGIPSHPAFVLTDAVDVNNNGQILCEGYEGTARHVYLLTPTGKPWPWWS